MRATAGLLVALLLLAAPGPTLDAGELHVLEGEFMSGYQDRERPLTARFRAIGEGRFAVEFDFVFNGQDHTYAGTAEGSLSGELAGTVRTENPRRTFTFEGEFRDGVFRGTHAEVYRGRERRTGTLTLRG